MNPAGPAWISAEFDRLAEGYDQHAALEQEVGARLLERLSFQRRSPERILDLGCGTGHMARQLKNRYRKAQVIGLDASPAMCRQTRQRSRWFRPLLPVCADATQLPLAGRSVDLIFSNLAVQWCADFAALAAGFRRILRPGGLLLFSTLGPDSLQELRRLGSRVQPAISVRQFPDMHEAGDALQAAGFSEPVMDMERIRLEYVDIDGLLAELEGTGASAHFSDWTRLRAQRLQWARAYRDMAAGTRLPVTWEVVYGAAFGPGEGQPIKSPEGDVVTFSVDSLRFSRPRR